MENVDNNKTTARLGAKIADLKRYGTTPSHDYRVSYADEHGKRAETTQHTLLAWFNLVADRADWKGPVNAFVILDTLAERAMIAAAVVHFTGTVPTIEPAPGPLGVLGFGAGARRRSQRPTPRQRLASGNRGRRFRRLRDGHNCYHVMAIGYRAGPCA